MRKKVLILAAAVLLALVLAVPASASKPTTVSGTFTLVPPVKDQLVPEGNRCFVNVWYNATLGGDITASCAIHEWQVAHGPCAGSFPGSYNETLHLEADCAATVEGKSGTFHLRGNGEIVPVDPPTPWVMTWRENCVILEGTGDLAGLRGSLTLEGLPAQPETYAGEIHFDGE